MEERQAQLMNAQMMGLGGTMAGATPPAGVRPVSSDSDHGSQAMSA